MSIDLALLSQMKLQNANKVTFMRKMTKYKISQPKGELSPKTIGFWASLTI